MTAEESPPSDDIPRKQRNAGVKPSAQSLGCIVVARVVQISTGGANLNDNAV